MTDLLTTTEVATRLSVDRSTISRWVAFGKITPAHRLPGNGQMLFRPADVERLAKQLAA